MTRRCDSSLRLARTLSVTHKTSTVLEIQNPLAAHHNQQMGRVMPKYKPWMVWLCLSLLPCGFPTAARSQRPPVVPEVKSGPLETQGTGTSAAQDPPQQRLPGSISGTIVDPSGGAVAGARVRLSRDDQSPDQEVLSGDDGQFSFANVAPGPFGITITSAGFATQASAGILQPGESYAVPQIAMVLATAVTEVHVVVPRAEMAEDQIKAQEKQRVLGVVPNFYVSYNRHAVPLNSKQKFELAWKTTIDPVSFGITGAIAGIQQSQNDFSGYGQGAQGYARRFGASYGNFVASTYIGGAILPSLLKQDPRYFYKGSGTKRSRMLYAIANSVICKGDNGHWQANYSSILGSLAAGGVSNLYYPPENRDGLELTFQNALIGIGESAAVNLLQEFVMRKLTRNVPNYEPANPPANP
jgi:carboxypeptidase family protein